MESAMDEDTEQRELHPLDDPPTQTIQPEAPPEPVVDSRGRGLGGNRHLGSVVLSSVAVLGAYGASDYALYRTLGRGLTVYQAGAVADNSVVAAAVAPACLVVA